MTRKVSTAIATALAVLTFGLAAAPAVASPLSPVHKACFFQGVGFTGPSICFENGQRKFMPAAFAHSISSVQIIGNVSASLCTGRVARGTCQTFTSSRWQVPSPLYNNTKSFQVQRNWMADNALPTTLPTTMTMMTMAR